jgi:hypothetical protein
MIFPLDSLKLGSFLPHLPSPCTQDDRKIILLSFKSFLLPSKGYSSTGHKIQSIWRDLQGNSQHNILKRHIVCLSRSTTFLSPAQKFGVISTRTLDKT